MIENKREELHRKMTRAAEKLNTAKARKDLYWSGYWQGQIDSLLDVVAWLDTVHDPED